MPHHLESLVNSEIAPMVNQIEFHPGMIQKETVEYCKKNHILVEAWSPLGPGRSSSIAKINNTIKDCRKSKSI